MMTLNVAHGSRNPIPSALLRRRTLARNLDAIAALVRRAEADVVALQEIDRASALSKNVDHFTWIAEAAAMPFRVHAPHGERARLGMRHGHALLSRHELYGAEDLRFDRRFCHDKGFVLATLEVPELGGRAIDAVSVHLEPFAPNVRRSQILELGAALRARRERTKGRPLVVMGDMNTGYGDDRRGVGLLAKEAGLGAWRPSERMPTYAMSFPLVRFDWILTSPELRIVDQRTLPDRVSDHAAVVADIALSA
ncbi:MAG: endonuclease/exonuclease/phosphatase family protein [Deltaproteobacteria bacterium]|nr:endonuclease/exonuclease/phosphatase family protein [Deltaproteobacteria bacterium]